MPKIYQLGISKVYLSGHPKAGQPTHFKEKILCGVQNTVAHCKGTSIHTGSKIHTIRPNYEYWKGIEAKVNSGEGILSLREWEGTPYKSKRPEFLPLTKMRVDKLVLEIEPRSSKTMAITTLWIDDQNCSKRLNELAVNDGLENSMDLVQWLGFKTFHGCLISFTDHRYQPLE